MSKTEDAIIGNRQKPSHLSKNRLNCDNNTKEGLRCIEMS